MKSIPLRTLLRDPIRVKRVTRGGDSIQITDNGRPLWILKSASDQPTPTAEEDAEIEEMLEEVLRGKPSKLSVSEVLDQSRR